MSFEFDIAFLLPFAIALIATGAVAGTLAGLLGVGGGIVIVPILVLLFPYFGIPEDIRMHLAVGTSLATIVPTGLSSARSHWRRGGVDPELLKLLGPWVVLGVLIGVVIGARAGGDALRSVFAAVAALVAAQMAFGREGMQIADKLPSWPGRALMGGFIGGFSVVMGIGGGTLGVTSMTLFGVPIRRAVGTAAALGPIIALPGVVGFIIAGLGEPDLPPYSLGYANLVAFAMIVPSTILFAPVGAKLAHTISPKLLRKAFALFLFVTACRMAWSVLT
ncbi:sulfite exporter TauE/SafE family protein [Rhodospirillaceae bacterium KN72]|uniref:Probable membrane transporter protein n=1 Tax=Pacificispira spongiicola TaxID=2729598 RepID=A0A7Y0E140_9PROT|nr:sulfite exporter TauE/SafE family protein [Pacificispira spongiicola]NMM45313.1 sulfite exporter TauE/SafE family protein [Pacificispira spongiicola]